MVLGDNTHASLVETYLGRDGQVYLTNRCDETRDYGDAIIIKGDIIVRSTDGLTYRFIPESVFLPLTVAP